MTPYAMENGSITQEHFNAMKMADMVMALLPLAHDVDYRISCHHVCCVWHCLTADHQMGSWFRGKYAEQWEHSWIELGSNVLLDIYPVAGLRPTMIAVDLTIDMESPARSLYEGEIQNVDEMPRDEDEKLLMTQSAHLAQGVYDQLVKGDQQPSIQLVDPKQLETFLEMQKPNRKKRRTEQSKRRRKGGGGGGLTGWGNGRQR